MSFKVGGRRYCANSGGRGLLRQAGGTWTFYSPSALAQPGGRTRLGRLWPREAGGSQRAGQSDLLLPPARRQLLWSLKAWPGARQGIN